jgi:hypothetical protein
MRAIVIALTLVMLVMSCVTERVIERNVRDYRYPTKITLQDVDCTGSMEKLETSKSLLEPTNVAVLLNNVNDLKLCIAKSAIIIDMYNQSIDAIKKEEMEYKEASKK